MNQGCLARTAGLNGDIDHCGKPVVRVERCLDCIRAEILTLKQDIENARIRVARARRRLEELLPRGS